MEIINNLKEYLQAIQNTYKYKKVILFGSRANNTNRPNSDIDLLVEFDKNHKSLFLIANLINNLQDKFNLKVDVIPFPIPNTIAGLKLNIDKEVVLYELKYR